MNDVMMPWPFDTGLAVDKVMCRIADLATAAGLPDSAAVALAKAYLREVKDANHD